MARLFTAAPDRAILRIEGADRIGFLQGLVSNDVAKATETEAIWAALLTAQGKYLFDFLIVAAGDGLLIEAESARLPDLARRLSIYKLRAAVKIAPAPDLAVYVAWGEVDRIGVPDPRSPVLGRRVYSPTSEGDAPLRAAGLEPAPFADWDRLRIAAGVPDGTRDLVVEKSILMENGFDTFNGIAWDKGCYIGQELTARTRYRGLVKKRLMPVRIEGPLPAPGTPILRPDGSDGGEIRSGLGDMALALVRLEAVGERLTAGGAAVVVAS